ncbi:MAG: dienelactone hydrolase family protein [Sphingomonadaceae bacterium]|nr:dienelactone hydrolase family protein [Sphingomonadaceae bacterium]
MAEDDGLRARAIALHDHFTHVSNDRRGFMADMVRLAGSAAAAEALIAGIASNPAAAAIVAEDDPRLVTTVTSWETAPGRRITGYQATPEGKAAASLPAIVVIHENRGLQPYTRDVARRAALAGFVALAPDLLTPSGGSPQGDDDKARAMIAALDLAQTTQDAIATLKWIKAGGRSNGKVGIVGFCWGGALADRVAVAGGHAADAVVAFYGPPPDPSEAAKVEAPILLHYAGLDTRVDAAAQPWVAALKAAHKNVTSYLYPNVNHAFHNDTAPDRYNAAAATLAWDRTIAFFKEHLA